MRFASSRAASDRTLSGPAIGLGLWLATAPLLAQVARSPLDSYAEALEVDMVEVEVMVTDRDGKPVTGLRAEDFRLFEDGKKVAISQFTAAAAAPETGGDPTLILVVDNRHLEHEARNRVLSEVRAYLEGQQPSAPMMVVTYDGALQVRQAPTSDSREVAAVLEVIEAGPVSSEELLEARRATANFLGTNIRQMRRGLEGSTVAQAAFDSTFSQLKGYGKGIHQDTQLTLAALGSLVATVGGLEGPKALLLLSEGLPLQPLGKLIADFQLRSEGQTADSRDTVDISAADSRPTVGDVANARLESLGRTSQEFEDFNLEADFEQLARVANRNRVGFYPLATAMHRHYEPEPARQRQDEDERRVLSDAREGVELLAERTGGMLLPTEEEIASFLERARSGFRAHYSLGFEPKKTAEEGGYHSLKVRLRGRGLDVRHREGYVRRSFSTRFAERAVSALRLDYAQNSHQLGVEIDKQTQRDDGGYDVNLLVLFPIDRIGLVESEGLHWAEARVVALFVDGDGQISPPRHAQVPLQIPDADIERAKQQNFGGLIPLNMPAGRCRLALGMWDVVADRVSFIIEELEIGG